MAKRKKHRKSRRSSGRRHQNAHRTRRSRRHSMLGNAPGMWKDMIVAVLAGGAGFIVARKSSDYAEAYLPGMVPAHDVVAPALVAAAIIALTEKMISDPKLRVAAQAAGAIPLVEALVNRAGLGHMLGTQRTLMLPPAPAGATPALQAELAAALEDSYTSDY